MGVNGGSMRHQFFAPALPTASNLSDTVHLLVLCRPICKQQQLRRVCNWPR